MLRTPESFAAAIAKVHARDVLFTGGLPAVPLSRSW
jgi:hypothetical protein